MDSSALPQGVEVFHAEIPMTQYISGFRDVGRFIGYCRECRNYGRRWGCPPYDFDTTAVLRRYSAVRLTAYKIQPPKPDMALEAAYDIIKPVRLVAEKELLRLEKELGGMAFSFGGHCYYCDSPCARESGQPCRHPDLVRPSLEAFGFDITKTLSELFGMEIVWIRDGRIPEYLTLVAGVAVP